MPVDNPSILLTEKSISLEKDTGYPNEHGLQEIMDSFLDFLERLENQETAIPGKDAAVSQGDEAVAELHFSQNNTAK